MSQYRAAILTGPRGPFTVVELTEAQRRQLSVDDRRALAECVRSHHGHMAVVFVTASPSTLNALHGQDVTADLHECLSSHGPATVPWTTVDGPRPAAGT